MQTNIVEQIAFSGPAVRVHPPGPDLSALTGEQVGVMVRDAILENRFLLLTHPKIQEVLVARAQDPEDFVERQIASLEEQDG